MWLPGCCPIVAGRRDRLINYNETYIEKHPLSAESQPEKEIKDEKFGYY